MLLNLAVGVLLCLSPLLQGSWDLWSQTLVRLAALALGSGWLCWRILVGTVPVPDRRTLWWAGLLALLTVASAATSPLHALVWPEAFNAFAAIGLVCAAPLLTRQGREGVETSLRVTVWVLWALAFYQRYFLHENPPASALVNPNVFAGFLLMALSLAWRWHDWALAAATLWALTWTRSLGAWMGLSAALVALGWRRYPPFFWGGVLASFVAGIALYGKLQDPESAHRLLWWSAAGRMVADRPWLGWGPGAFGFLLPAYRPDATGGLGSLYAHQAWLEAAVGWGVPGAALVSAAVVGALWMGRGILRLGLLAVCLQAMGDYALLIPANLWVFAYLTGDLLPAQPELAAVPSRRKPLAIAVVLFATVLLAWAMGGVWQADRLCARAQEAAGHGDPDGARHLLQEAQDLAPGWPNPVLLRARIEEEEAARLHSPGLLKRAIWYQEAGARLNPYRPPSWRDLARLRAAAGDASGAEAAMEKGRLFVPWLK